MPNVYIPPPRTMMEVFQSLPEGTLAQLINNQIIMSPAPTTTHQIILGKVYFLLYEFVQKRSLGQVLVSPCDVYLNRKNAFQPDIIFISNENLHDLKENGFYSAPDLVIEILSPASWRFDKEDKKDEYERSGVKEYWMIEPNDKSTEGFWLEANEFKLLPGEKGQISFKLFPLVINF